MGELAAVRSPSLARVSDSVPLLDSGHIEGWGSSIVVKIVELRRLPRMRRGCFVISRNAVRFCYASCKVDVMADPIHGKHPSLLTVATTFFVEHTSIAAD